VTQKSARRILRSRVASQISHPDCPPTATSIHPNFGFGPLAT
jgi:hypothetical protein